MAKRGGGFNRTPILPTVVGQLSPDMKEECEVNKRQPECQVHCSCQADHHPDTSLSVLAKNENSDTKSREQLILEGEKSRAQNDENEVETAKGDSELSKDFETEEDKSNNSEDKEQQIEDNEILSERLPDDDDAADQVSDEVTSEENEISVSSVSSVNRFDNKTKAKKAVVKKQLTFDDTEESNTVLAPDLRTRLVQTTVSGSQQDFSVSRY